MTFCLAAGIQPQSQTTPASQGSDGKPATKETSSAQQTKGPDSASQTSAALPDSTRLEPIFTPKPVYPPEAVTRAIQGQVVIQLEISETGDVVSATPVSGEPILAEAAIDAMKKWKFKPYIKDGKAVRARAKMPHNFAFQGTTIKIKGAATPSAQPSETSAVNDTSTTDPAASQRPLKLKVSQGVMDGIKIYDLPPRYPPAARQKHIQGEVVLRATIGKDGLIHNLQVVSGPVELVQAAVGAVQQWRYRPYLLEGEPVEVETIVRVQFHM